MTREEAVKELEEDKDLYMPKEWIECFDRDTPDGRLITALEMAIKALEQEPCGDAISRQAVIKALWHSIEEEKGFETYSYAEAVIADAKDEINELPPVKLKNDENGFNDFENKAVRTTDDLISRQAAKEAIRAKFKDLPSRCEINEVLNGLQPVSPARPKGEWIPQPSNKEQGERDFIWWKCSKCGQIIFSETEKDRLTFHRFCGRCGARNER